MSEGGVDDDDQDEDTNMMGSDVYEICMDTVLAKRMQEWEEAVQINNVEHEKRWNDDVKRMEEDLCREGLDSHVSEMYSPPRVTSMASKMGLIPGMALDLTTVDEDDGKPWDFNDEKKRRKAMKLVRKRKSLLLIVSPMCAAFSQLQSLNFSRMTSEDVEKVKSYGRKHLEFCMKLCQIQVEQGLYFLHEHPAGARSWSEPCVQHVLGLPGVVRVDGNMCAFGMLQRDKDGVGLVKKPTGFMTNSAEIARRLNQVCPGGHRHIYLISGRAKRAEVYPDELCREFLKGLITQMKMDGRLLG